MEPVPFYGACPPFTAAGKKGDRYFFQKAKKEPVPFFAVPFSLFKTVDKII
jgi:hypothetical protein